MQFTGVFIKDIKNLREKLWYKWKVFFVVMNFLSWYASSWAWEISVSSEDKLKKNESTGNSEINSINFYLAFYCHVNLDHNITLFLDLHQTFQKIPLLGGMWFIML